MKKLILFIFLLASQMTNSSVLYVSSLFDSGPGTLRDAISLALSGDTIDFSVSGTININSALVINRDLIILSPSADSITINGQNLTNLIEITGGNIFMSGLFLEGGWPDTIASGGAILKSSPGFLRIENSTFLSCTATWNGGAIVQDTGNMELLRCYFYNNDANASGGSIQNNGGTFYIYGCTFEEGTAGLSGGAISNSGGNMHIVNSTFYKNTAGSDGGVCEGDSIDMINCTLTSNTANGSGGAIKTGSGYLLNCIVYGNTAATGSNFSGHFYSYGHNLLGDTSGTGSIDSTDIYGPDPLLQPISYINGGLTPTCAIIAGSPCIDAGGCFSAPGFDQRDSLRIGIPDIGAFEFGGIPFPHYFAFDSMCVGDTVFFDNDTIVTAGVTMQILETTMGCDSIIEFSVSFISPDTTVTHIGDTITASSLADSWQWYDCNSMTILPNQTAQTFVATANGFYAVIVNQNGCVDTSACTLVSSVGVEDYQVTDKILVFPSVIKDYVNILPITTGMLSNEKINVQMLSITGELIRHQDFNGREKIIMDVKGVSAGIYLLRIQGAGINYVTRIVKE